MGARGSIPHIAFLKFHFIAAQKGPKFILKRHLLVVLTLIADVVPHRTSSAPDWLTEKAP